jgi:tRNA-dihydrouridine synthase
MAGITEQIFGAEPEIMADATEKISKTASMITIHGRTRDEFFQR